MMNMRNIKIDTIGKTITFEKSVTPSEIRQLIESLHNYDIVIQEPTKEDVKTIEETVELLRNRPKPSDFKLPFNPTCTSPCFCSGKCKSNWSGSNSNAFKWNLQGR